MFRPMRRIKQQLAENEALEVLKSAKRGVLSVIGDDGWPYGIHLNPYWEDGRLYFHGAKAGHKIDALRRDSRASFTVIDDGVKDDGGWAYTFNRRPDGGDRNMPPPIAPVHAEREVHRGRD